jgi:hypothetical protein
MIFHNQINQNKMSYPRETKIAAQDAYHEARAFGHTKEEARGLRDNWKSPEGGNSSWSDDDDDDYIGGDYCDDNEDDGIDYWD